MLFCLQNISNIYIQNAWQTERPKEMVEAIGLGIPVGMDLENPTEDAAFMARIGAKQIGAFEQIEKGTEYELANSVTGTKFAFAWFPMVGLFL